MHPITAQYTDDIAANVFAYDCGSLSAIRKNTGKIYLTFNWLIAL
jgi:hypothetical protein